MKTSKNLFLALVLVTLVISLTNFSYALSNQSMQAKEKLAQAGSAIEELIVLDIPIKRVNETHQSAKQIYEAQLNYERIYRNADYKLVIEYVDEILSIKEMAIKASDELKIFLEFYNESAEKTDLSEMDEEYTEIISSFEEERFEETINLVDLGYDTISDVETSQTTINAFRDATTRTLKNFFKENWIKLLIGLGAAIILFMIFKTSLKIYLVKRKKKHLKLRKATIEDLIKELQRGYFKDNTVSQLQYQTRLNKFEEMVRDINRQLPLLDEQMSLIDDKKDFKNFKRSKKTLEKEPTKEEPVKEEPVPKEPIEEKSPKEKIIVKKKPTKKTPTKKTPTKKTPTKKTPTKKKTPVKKPTKKSTTKKKLVKKTAKKIPSKKKIKASRK